MAAMSSSRDLRARLRERLEPEPVPEPAPGDRLAAVLLPLVEGLELTILLTRRTEHLSRHAGEISFPGGLAEEHDPELRATVLRECREELGAAAGEVDLLGALPAVHTFVSGILVVPFVGVFDARPALAPDPYEVAEVLEFPLRELAAAERTVEWRRDEGTYRGYAYEMDGATVWGATGRMLHELLALVDDETTWATTA